MRAGGDARMVLAVLRRTPTWLLERELAKRRHEVADPVLRVGDLVLDTAALTATWRGRCYDVTDRQMDVLYFLARARQAGHKTIRGQAAAVKVFREMDAVTAIENWRQNVHSCRQRIPGLITSKTRVGYGLDVEDDEEGRWVA